ncbi:MAG: sensor histidine kinase N-terminal domain-containing protein, partial [Alteraurantiacibacter sp.]|nr:sensor histidine kinase N-terminal domain-containing protein [Alteraurantiacibacter sp.]
MMVIAAGWIFVLLALGGVALDRALTNLVERQFEEQLEISLNAMVASAEIDPFGEVLFNRILGDQRFLEPNSGYYWQISGGGFQPYLSRSLWDQPIPIRENVRAVQPIFYDVTLESGEKLRVVQRTVGLPGSNAQWQFVVAASREKLDQQLTEIRAILAWSFAVLGIGLFLMAMLQTWYGLGPLRRIRRAIARIRTSGANRVTDPLPQEVQPMVEELNALLAHSERQAEEARTHAGNLAHALKTPLTVLTNAATAHAPDLDETVLREAAVMRRQVDHHLARVRAAGRRAVGLA